VIDPAVVGAITSPYGLPPCSIGSIVDPIVVILATERLLRIVSSTVTGGLVAVTIPPAPVQLIVYVTVPLAVGATVTWPLMGLSPVKEPPVMLDVPAEQEVAYVEAQPSCTPCPRLMLAAWAGEVNITVGIGPR
jgi:hypothetical protein